MDRRKLINFKQISKNRTRVWNREIDYIMIHDAGNPNIGANAEMHFQHFNNAYHGSSADIFIDDTQVLQINDYRKYRSWHCGDGKGRYGITNNNSIGIEMCVNFGGNLEKVISDTINTTAEKMHELNLGIDSVKRHYDASRKICPAIFSKGNWGFWIEFKDRVQKRYEEIKLEKDLEILARAGIISSPNYWKKKYKDIKYFDLLISKFVKYIKV